MQVLFYSDSGCSIVLAHGEEWRSKVENLCKSNPVNVNRLELALLRSSLTNLLWCRMDVAHELVTGGEDRLHAFLREQQHESVGRISSLALHGHPLSTAPAAFQPHRRIPWQGRILFLVSPETREMVDEWARIALERPHLFRDAESSLPNHPWFVEHRHDQSILSALLFNRNWRGSEWKCVAPTRIKDCDPWREELVAQGLPTQSYGFKVTDERGLHLARN